MTPGQARSEEHDIGLRFNSSSFRNRAAYFGIGVAAFLIAYMAGAAVPITDEEADEMATAFEEQVGGIGAEGLASNNIVAALIMFVPGFGAGFGAYTAASTGMIFNALMTSYGIEGVSPLSVIATPFGILEILGYGLAMSRSGMLVYQLAKRRSWKTYAIPTGIEIAVVVVALLVAGVIEADFIQQ